MSTKYIFNPGPNVMFLAGRMIQPGDGRDIPLADLPEGNADASAQPAKLAEPSLDDELQAVRAQSVKALVAVLPGMTIEALERLRMLEEADDTPRKTLLGAIEAELIERASRNLPGGNDTPPGGGAPAPGNDTPPGGDALIPGNDTPPGGGASAPGNDTPPGGA